MARLGKGVLPAESNADQAFTDFKIYKVLTHEDENSVSYSIQYFSDAIEKIVHYLNHDGKILVEEHRTRFKDRHVVFNTLLQEA